MGSIEEGVLIEDEGEGGVIGVMRDFLLEFHG